VGFYWPSAFVPIEVGRSAAGAADRRSPASETTGGTRDSANEVQVR
jgi:hypothetical protein